MVKSKRGDEGGNDWKSWRLLTLDMADVFDELIVVIHMLHVGSQANCIFRVFVDLCEMHVLLP